MILRPFLFSRPWNEIHRGARFLLHYISCVRKDHLLFGFDDVGNMYIADIFNDRVRKVDTNGIITTVAGNGTNGFSGDGGPAIRAQLADPASVALDAAGNLFIADLFNDRIRKMDTNGIITTVAGGGTQYPGDGGAATNGVASESDVSGMDSQRFYRVEWVP